MRKRILISGGGTGGHIFPALAIAKELEKRYDHLDLLFVGASDRMEMDKIPAAGYKVIGLWIAGFQRSLSIRNVLFPVKLILSILKSFFIVIRFKPNVVIGTGGYASGPILWVASILKIPTLIQEQNSYPGVTNRILASRVSKICVAYTGLERFFPPKKIELFGNPIRSEIEFGIYNYSNEGVASWYDFASAIFEYSKMKTRVNPIRTEKYPTPAKRPYFSVLDKNKIKESLNIKIPHWRDSLRNCLKKYNS